MTNPLYPAFFRLDRLQMLVVGAGEVGEEKLSFILKSSPNANVTIVAPWMGEELRELLEGYQRQTMEKELARAQVQGKSFDAPDLFRADDEAQFDVDKLKAARELQLHDTYFVFDDETQLGGLYYTPAGGSVIYLKREFKPEDVEMADLVVAATNFREINQSVYDAAKANRRLCNIADTPSLCDFYLGSIVTRGPLKIAISTNGQSPTFAKRFRQFLEAELPDFETTNLLDNLKTFRDRLTGDFKAKVRQLNSVTNSLLASTEGEQPGCRCPDGECLVEAAAKAPAP
jgi:precorrin-2 dehydrogenase/sirohydrochlorin ferrochelatase